MRIGFMLLALSMLAGSVLAQQPQPKYTSPRGQAEFTLKDGKKVLVDYSRPSMHERKIMGGLVPYGKVWRTGANAATTFETQADLEIAGKQVPAGKYTLYTIPNEDSWTVIINKQTGQWGTVYKEDQDLARVNVKPVKLDQAVDQFTIAFQPDGDSAGVMKLEWENTSVPVEFKEPTK
jgi:hypothetical protein